MREGETEGERERERGFMAKWPRKDGRRGNLYLNITSTMSELKSYGYNLQDRLGLKASPKVASRSSSYSIHIPC